MDVAPQQPDDGHPPRDTRGHGTYPPDRHQDHHPEPESLTVDCDGCVARGLACNDCVVSVLLGPPRSRLELDAEELSALDALADAGLVPPLRLVRGIDAPATETPAAPP